MRICKTVLVIVFLSVLISCSDRQISACLDDIESYVEERPDSALTVLESIDPETMTFPKERALYSLLKTMSLDKSLVEIRDTNLIDPAVAYYRWHKQNNRYAASLFYRGRVSFNNGKYPEALILYQKALKETSSVYWKGMITGDMAFVFNKCYNIDDELKYARKSLEYWQEWGDTIHIDQAMMNYAVACNNNNLFNIADSLMGVLCSREGVLSAAHVTRAELSVKRKNPDYEAIVGWFDKAKNEGAGFSAADWYGYAYALWKTGQKNKADSIIKQLSDYSHGLPAAIWLSRMAADRKDFRTAYEYEKSIVELSDSLVRKQLEQSVFKAQTNQYKKSLESEQVRRKGQLTVFSFIIVIFLLFGTVVFLSFKNRSRALAAENERLSGIAEECSRLLQIAKNENIMSENARLNIENKLSRLRTEYAKLYQSQFTEIGRVLDYCHRGDKADMAARRYGEKVRTILQEITDNGKGQKMFEDRIDKDLGGVMHFLRQDFPDFKESDFRLLSFLIVGFDATTRAILLDESINNMRVKKSRIVKKILDSQSEHRDLYRSLLHPGP